MKKKLSTSNNLKSSTIFDNIQISLRAIRKKTTFSPDIGIILGTGLGRVVTDINIKCSLNYSEIPYFLRPTVESHFGRLIFGELSGKRVVAMQGRLHYYEGYDMINISFPVRVMKELGVKILIVSNACGGLNPQFKPGDIMVITDHINMTAHNPLRGIADPRLGPRFPDMYNCYAKDLVTLAEKAALKIKLPLQRGVYVSVLGPNLETAAEYRCYRILGGDVIGMSTVPEVIVARQIGIKVLGFSIITDMGLPDAMKPCDFERILKTAKMAEHKLVRLIHEVMKLLK